MDGECRFGTGRPRPARPGGPPDSSRSLDEAVSTRQPGAEDIRPLFLYFGDMNVNGTAQGRLEPVEFLSACDFLFFLSDTRVTAWATSRRKTPVFWVSRPQHAGGQSSRMLFCLLNFEEICASV